MSVRPGASCSGPALSAKAVYKARVIISYATLNDLANRLSSAVYIELTDDADTGSADPTKATEALAGAEAEVDSYLGTRYAVPLDTSQEPSLASLLKSITLDLAEYRLRSRRPPVPTDSRQKAESALQFLQRVVSGQAVLPAQAPIPGHDVLTELGYMTSDERTLSRTELDDL